MTWQSENWTENKHKGESMLFDKNLYLGQKKKCGSSVLTDPAYSHNKMIDPQLFFLLAAVNFSFLESQVLMWIISHFSGWKCVWIILIYMSPSLSHVIYLLCSSFYTCISDFSHWVGWILHLCSSVYKKKLRKKKEFPTDRPLPFLSMKQEPNIIFFWPNE